MASILRSSKFVRYIAGFAKNVVVNTPREFDGTLVNTASAQCYCGAFPRGLATQTSAQQHDQNLERRLKSLDQDVRKSGRISRRDIEDVLEEIRNARSATTSQSLLVIRCCGSLVPDELPEVRTKLVQEIWNTLNKINVPMDVSHYNALLRVYLENEHPFSPTDFLSDMESKGIEPNRVTYQRLISRYCQEGDIEGATKILEYMREKQMAVNENVFNALIFGHSQAGDMDSAHGILSVMAQAGLEPSADTYTTLLCGYAKQGNMDQINKLIAECEEKEIFLLDKDYLDIVYALATNGHGQHVPEILSRVKRSIGYNQDALNLILRLINKGQDDAAFAVLKTMVRSTQADGSLMPIGTFFIRQMVKADRDLETIVSYCQKLEEEQMYSRGLLLAAECSLEQGKEELAYALFEKLKEQGLEIRQHYFWPLIVSKGDDPSGRGVVAVLQKMHEFGLTPSLETLRDWVLPNLKGNSSQLLTLLREANVSVGASACSIVTNLLIKNEIAEAATIASSVPAYYIPELIRRPLTNALCATGDVDSYVSIIRQVYENLNRRQNMVQSDNGEKVDGAAVVGAFLVDLASNKKNFEKYISVILEKLVEQGLSITTSTAEKIESKLGEKMTETISDLLGKLTSGELTPVPISKRPTYVPYHEMNTEQLEKLVENLESKNIDAWGYKRRLLTLYYRGKHLEKLENLIENLKGNPNFELGPGIHAILLDTYAYHGHLDKALEQLEIVKKLEGDKFELDEDKVVRLAGLMVKQDKFEDAIKLLEEIPRDKVDRGYTYNSLVWRTLNWMAEQGQAENLEKFLDTLIKHDYIDVNNVFLGPLVKVYLVKEDMETALKKFEWAVEQYRLTPWKNELACKLIQKEDADKLQKLTDLSTIVHGEINSLYDLVFAFVECGRIRQARKILETPGLQNRPQRINNACERFQQEGLVKPLEGLKDATKDLTYIDRNDIYYQLLLSYIKQNDAEKCMGLWTQMQEEDLAPSDQFLLTLGSFLQENGLQVPFSIPQPKIKQRPATTPGQEQQTVTSRPRPGVSVAANNFRTKLSQGDVDGCLKTANHAQVSVSDASQLIEKLIHQERLQDATKVTMTLLNRGAFPVQKIFRFLLNKLAAAGQVDALEQIGEKISVDVKRLISFDNRFCHANIVAGRVEAYLQKLEQDLDNASDDQLEAISSQFPRGGAYGILERHPEYTDKFEQMAIKYAKRGIVGPLNVLWTKYFISNEVEKSNQLWHEYLKDAPRIMFQKIIQIARDTHDEELIKRLTEHLKISNVTPGAIGNIFSCYIDVLVAKNKPNEVEVVFQQALSQVSIDNINRTAVLRVKEVFEKSGKTFDYPIPAKHKSSTQEED
ncbi:leucine-rich PPR motif-containing protein, mitochondrial isoform X2 [Anthonomus grandis grandis]|uniref:leucine-rich PPR motif-containing protein, mitochondrial isoform X2 n=1 Tax=Anthonomus grandis grandis TaxID=2921223 RepID=UPI00216570A7|nr:leucine-rich PPR motif-containing protein, mitochondrial isoform X2 [Anthonomus grandis grandis]